MIFKGLMICAMMLAPMAMSAQTDDTSDFNDDATQQNMQRPPRREHMSHFTVDSLNTYFKENVGLTDEQLKSVEALNSKYSDVIEGPKRPDGPRPGGDNDQNGRPAGPPPSDQNGQDTASRQNPFKMMEERQTAYETELKAILNDDQYAQYEKVKTKFASQRRMGRRGGHKRS